MMRMARNPSSFGMNVAIRSQASVRPLSMSMASMFFPSPFQSLLEQKLTTQREEYQSVHRLRRGRTHGRKPAPSPPMPAVAEPPQGQMVRDLDGTYDGWWS